MLMTTVPDLNQLQWRNRVLLIFSASENDPLSKKQMGIVGASSPGFDERDLKVFSLSRDDEDVQVLRKKLHLPGAGFEVVLIGKDGGVKLRKQRPISAEELFETIDGMPMRKEEMKQRQ